MSRKKKRKIRKFFFNTYNFLFALTKVGADSASETRLFALNNPARGSGTKVLFDPTFDKDVSTRMQQCGGTLKYYLYLTVYIPYLH